MITTLFPPISNLGGKSKKYSNVLTGLLQGRKTWVFLSAFSISIFLHSHLLIMSITFMIGRNEFELNLRAPGFASVLIR